MVTTNQHRWNAFVWTAIILGIIVVVQILVPSIATERSNPYVRSISGAVGAFYTQNGRYPTSLCEAETFLTRGTISHVAEDRYSVEIVDSARQEVIVLEAQYKIDADGVVEEMYARVIDKRRR